ncbi:MAG: ATP-binding protein, partial [Verrucomicrobiales bacterium]
MCPRSVTADVGKLRQTLINLIGNAIKFTNEGRITLRVKADGLLDDRCTLSFELEDTGRGIAEDEVAGLFDKFFQAEAGRQSMEGTGLGLAISRKFIEFMGGEIVVRSVYGEGSVFEFEFPVLISASPAVDLDSEAATAATRDRFNNADQNRDRTILIAEDQVANRLLLSTILKKAGFNIVEAINGSEA